MCELTRTSFVCVVMTARGVPLLSPSPFTGLHYFRDFCWSLRRVGLLYYGRKWSGPVIGTCCIVVFNARWSESSLLLFGEAPNTRIHVPSLAEIRSSGAFPDSHFRAGSCNRCCFSRNAALTGLSLTVISQAVSCSAVKFPFTVK